MPLKSHGALEFGSQCLSQSCVRPSPEDARLPATVCSTNKGRSVSQVASYLPEERLTPSDTLVASDCLDDMGEH